MQRERHTDSNYSILYATLVSDKKMRSSAVSDITNAFITSRVRGENLNIGVVRSKRQRDILLMFSAAVNNPSLWLLHAATLSRKRFSTLDFCLSKKMERYNLCPSDSVTGTMSKDPKAFRDSISSFSDSL